MPKVSIPEDYLCPITHEMMKDPVATPDGQIYERKAIEAWLERHDTSPLTNVKLPGKYLMPIPLIKRQIQAFLESLCSQEEFLNAIKGDNALSIEKLNYTQAHLEAKDKDGLTSLERAVYYGYESMLEFLKACQGLKEGYVPEACVRVYHGGDERGGLLFSIYKERPKRQDPLTLAAGRGYTKVVSLLLSKALLKKDVDLPTRCSVPLQIAAQNGHVAVIKVLLAAGANPNFAIESGYDYSGERQVYPLHLAASGGHTEVMRILLEAGANLEAPYSDKEGVLYGGTALTKAIYSNQIEAVRVLIEAGANLEAQVTISGEHPFTPLGMAAYLGHRDIVTLLINAGASLIPSSTIPLRDEEGMFGSPSPITPPLHIAAKKGNLELIKVLLEGGASPKLANYGKTPLQVAIENGQSKAAEFMTAYHQELKRKRNQAPSKLVESEKIIQQLESKSEETSQEIVRLKDIVAQQQEKINQLEEQLSQVLAHLKLSVVDQATSTFKPGFFK